MSASASRSAYMLSALAAPTTSAVATSAMRSRATGSGPGATSAPHNAVTMTSAAMLGFVSSTSAPSVARRPRAMVVVLALGTLHGLLQRRERLVDDRFGTGVGVADVPGRSERLAGNCRDAAHVELPEADVVVARELLSLVMDAVEARHVGESVEGAARHVAAHAGDPVQTVDHF